MASSRIESKLDLASIRWLRETTELQGEHYTASFWAHAQHDALFPAFSVVAVELDDANVIQRTWFVETYVPAIEIPPDCDCPNRHKPPENKIVFASSIAPDTPSRPFTPHSNRERYYPPLSGPPARFFDRWSVFVADKVIVYRTPLWRRAVRSIRRGFRRVVNLFRGKR